MKIKNLLNVIGKEVSQNRSSVLTGVAVVGMVGAFAYMVTKSIPNTVKIVEENKEELEKSETPKRDTVKLVWKEYLVPVSLITLSATSTIGANMDNLKKSAALASAYALAENKIRKMEGLCEKRDEKIPGEKSQNNLSENNLIIQSSVVKCKDEFSGREFEATIKDLNRLESFGNQMLLSHFRWSLNELYEELGLEAIEGAEGWGWNVNSRELRSKPVEINLKGDLNSFGVPCVLITTNADRFDAWL